MNHGSLDTCEKMRRLYQLLRDNDRVSSMDIARHLPCVAPSTEASALRHELQRKPRDGFNYVEHVQEGKIHYYSLGVRKPEQMDIAA